MALQVDLQVDCIRGEVRQMSFQLGDLFLQFVSWRGFGFHELMNGNVALWNPFVFAGAPYFGGAKAALLYPINLLTMLMPLAASINWGIALNAFLFGAFIYAWMIFRGLKNGLVS